MYMRVFVLLVVKLFYLLLQLKKTSETTKHLPSPEFGPEWVDTLCNVSNQHIVCPYKF